MYQLANQHDMASKAKSSIYYVLKIPRPLITPPNPPIQPRPIPHAEPNLEHLRIQRQRRPRRIALERVHDRVVRPVLCGHDAERADQPQERRVQLAVGQVRARAHPTARAVREVRRAAAVGDVEVAVRVEGRGVGEVGGVVVGGPRVLRRVS